MNVSSQVESILALSSPTSTEETKLLLDHAADAEEESILALSSTTSTEETKLPLDRVADAEEDANTSPILEYSTRSKNKEVGTSKSTPLLMDELSSDNVPLSLQQKSEDRLFRSSSAILLVSNTFFPSLFV